MESTTPHRLATTSVAAPDDLDAFVQMEDAMLSVFTSEKPKLVVASGGTGATRLRLSSALSEKARRAGALVLTGEAPEQGEGEPWGLLAHALAGLTPWFAEEQGAFTAALRHRVAQAALGIGKLLVDICPELAPLVPASADLEPLPPWFARERAELLLLRLLDALTHPERPLVLLLEHAENADRATLRVLGRALAHPSMQNLVIVLFADECPGSVANAGLSAFVASAGQAAVHVDLGPSECAESAVGRTSKGRDAMALVLAARRAMDVAAFDVAEKPLYDAAALLAVEGNARKEAVELARSILAAKAACAAAAGDLERTSSLVDELAAHSQSEHETQEAERLLVGLLVQRGEHAEAMRRAASALARHDVSLDAEPSAARIEAAFARVWEALGERAIEEIADLEPMTASAPLDATAMLFAVHPAAEALSRDVGDLVACEMVRLALVHGNADASVTGHAAFAAALVRRFGDHRSGYRFGKVARDLCEQRGGPLHKGIVGTSFAGDISIWTHHLRASIGHAERAHEAALASGNVRHAQRSGAMVALAMLLKGDPLEDVAREAERHLGAIAGAADVEGHGELGGAIALFIARARGRAATTAPSARGPVEAPTYGALASRLLDLVSHVLAGERAEALDEDAALGPHLAVVASQIVTPERCFYAALAHASGSRPAEPEALAARLDALDVLARDLERWAERCPENYHHKLALVRAERCRLAGDDLGAMRCYDEAIHSARENGFTLNQALASEMALRFYEARGFSTIAATYLRLARAAYARWGGDAKVAELDRRYAKLDAVSGARQGGASSWPRKPFDLDVVTAVRSAQAVSEEIVLRRLVVTLMRIVIEHGGAQRCHVFLVQDGDLVHAGRAFVSAQGLEIEVPGGRSSEVFASLPESIIGYVRRTREPILLDDATAQPTFSTDPYIARARPRSVLCMPIVRQAELVGVFYMENNLVPSAFTPRRTSLLEFLAAQAAISLEHAKLYADLERQNGEHRRAEETLRRSEERLRRLVDIAGVIPWEADPETELFTYVGPQAEQRLGIPTSRWYKPNFLREHVHPADRDATLAAFASLCERGAHGEAEFRVLTQDGRVTWLHMVVSVAEREGGQRILSGFFFDVTERKEVEATLREQIEIIDRQREDIRTLSTPLLDVWDGVVAMPLLGAFDEERAARAMDVLLATISQKQVRCAILDLTGVATVDGPTAENISKLVRAVELLGARAIVAGIRSDVARTIVSSGIGLERVETKATLKDALRGSGAMGGGRAAGQGMRAGARLSG